MSQSNNAPVCFWMDSPMRQPEGVSRQVLFVNGEQTPFQIVVSERVAHRTMGNKCGLIGSGMGERGGAAILASGARTTALKHRAEQMAMEAA